MGLRKMNKNRSRSEITMKATSKRDIDPLGSLAKTEQLLKNNS